MASVLVLGRGWVGSAVAARASDAGHGVVAVDPPLDPDLASRDVAAITALRELVAGHRAAVVVNACGLVRGSDDDLMDANVRFPEWLCRSLAHTGVRLVHIGSASEYGDPGSADPIPESHPPRPVGPYATSKAAGSDVVMASRDDGLDALVARVFNLVDATVPPASPLHDWIDVLRGLPGAGDVEVWWPPTVRDFVRLDDAADALVGLGVATTGQPVVNVCSGIGLTFADIVSALAGRLGVRARIRSLDRPGIPAVVGDPARLREVVGSVPSMSVEMLARVAIPDEIPG